jgi:hypothetical protein
MVASQETIAAMLESNESWSHALHMIRFLGPIANGMYGPLDRLIEIQRIATPFMQKSWEFNVVARKEIECALRDDGEYLVAMNAHFSQLRTFLTTLRGTEENKISDRVLDYWIIKQLRGAVLSDLDQFIEPGYFDAEKEKFILSDQINNGKYLSAEIRWGYLAAKLGKQPYFESTTKMSARQVAASEVLMHLGMLASTAASMTVCTNLNIDAATLQVPGANAGEVAQQLRREHLPIFTKNLLQGLKQYLLHLSTQEAAPFVALLDNSAVISVRDVFLN